MTGRFEISGVMLFAKKNVVDLFEIHLKTMCCGVSLVDGLRVWDFAGRCFFCKLFPRSAEGMVSFAGAYRAIGSLSGWKC